MQAQGTYGQLVTRMEPAFNTAPTATVKPRKMYFKSESLGLKQDLISSALLRGGNRQPTAPVRGNIDVSGSIATELGATIMCLHAALGDMTSTPSGGTTASVTNTGATLSGQFLTIAAAAHGITGADVGKPLTISGATSNYTALNATFPIVDIPTAGSILVRVPAGMPDGTVTGTLTVNKYSADPTSWTHTIKSGGRLPSYQVEKGFLDIGEYFLYGGCRLQNLAFTLGAAGFFEVTTNWMGAGETVSSTPLDTAPSDPGKRSFEGAGITTANFKYKSGSGNLAAIASNRVKTFSMALDNTLDGDTYVVGGGGARTAINAGVLKLTGQIVCIFEKGSGTGTVNGDDLYVAAKNGTTCKFDVTINRGTGAGTDGNESLQLVIEECLLKPTAPPIAGPTGIMLTLDYEAFVSSGTAALTAVIKNAVGPGVIA